MIRTLLALPIFVVIAGSTGCVVHREVDHPRYEDHHERKVEHREERREERHEEHLER